MQLYPGHPTFKDEPKGGRGSRAHLKKVQCAGEVSGNIAKARAICWMYE